MPQRLLLPRSQAVGLDGRPLAGAKLYTYESGTSTPKAVFTDAGLSVAHANPVEADAAGRFPAMFLAAGDYKTILTDAADAVIATDDPVEGAGSLTGTTLGGPLTLSYANPVATLNKAASGQRSRLNGASNGLLRWSVVLGDNTAESGGNAGSNFVLEAHDDAGALLSSPFEVTRSTGAALFRGTTGFGDAAHALRLVTSNPQWDWDTDDYVNYDRSLNLLRFYIGGVERTQLGATGWNSINKPQLSGVPLGLNLSATTTLSGNIVDIGGIPSTARRVTVIFDGVSTNGTDDVLIQIGDAGGIETTGYVMTHVAINTTSASGFSRTTGWSFDTTAVSNVLCGTLTLHLADPATHSWVGHGVAANTEIVSASYCAGRKVLAPGPLTQIRITTTGGVNTFDAGTVTIAWEV